MERCSICTEGQIKNKNDQQRKEPVKKNKVLWRTLRRSMSSSTVMAFRFTLTLRGTTITCSPAKTAAQLLAMAQNTQFVIGDKNSVW
jgi:hypothetical protein